MTDIDQRARDAVEGRRRAFCESCQGYGRISYGKNLPTEQCWRCRGTGREMPATADIFDGLPSDCEPAA